MRRVRVGVVYGGRSSEHEVSLASAAAVCAHLDSERYEAVPIYVHRDGRWSLADQPPTELSAGAVIRETERRAPASGGPGELHFAAFPSPHPLITLRPEGPPAASVAVNRLAIDVIFPVVHGPHGEDGTLQGLLELANVPYVGAGVLASALAMDKAMAKVVFAAHDLPIVDHVVVTATDWEGHSEDTLRELSTRLRFPVFVKPANLGSSVGISKVQAMGTLAAAIDRARQFDRKIIVEAAVPDAREIECAVLGNDAPTASLPGEIITSGEFYDYEAKYVDDRSRTVVPADLTEAQTTAVQSMAVVAYRALDAAGMARVDFLLDRAGTLYLNEVNTIPGFTAISMYSKMWDASGVDYATLLDRLISLAFERHEQKQRLRTTGH